jgi:hypothetical protein
MPRKKEKRVEQAYSPNFLLLKRLIEIEVTGSVAVIPTREQVYQFLLNSKTIKEPRRTILAEKIRRFIWQPTAAKITEQDLDDMVRVAQSVIQFKDWNSFNDYFGDLNTTDQMPRLLHLFYNENRERDLNQSLIVELYTAALQYGTLKESSWKKPILREQQEELHVLNKFKIKKIEMEEIEVLHYHLRKCTYSTVSYNTLIEWYKKNKNIFYCCVDANYIEVKKYISFMIILPIKKEFAPSPFETHPYNFSPDMIESDKNSNITHLLIQLFITYRISVLDIFLNSFENIISNIGAAKSNLMIYAFACNEDIQVLLQSLGFKPLSYSWRAEYSANPLVPLYCIKWSAFKAIIRNKNQLL